jgi:RNA polymerase sigma-70 factor (ECF subfamily)
MLSNEDLAALLSRVALGDRAAFEGVYRATCAHLLGVAYRILNNGERAEEVLQEAFMNVWHSAGGFDASVAGPMTCLEGAGVHRDSLA